MDRPLLCRQTQREWTRFLELSSIHDLCITNTFFPTKPGNRMSWRHPDLVTGISWISSSHTVLSELCLQYSHLPQRWIDTDNSMIASKVQLQPRRIHRSKQKGRPRINAAMTSLPELQGRFASTIQEDLRNCLTTSAENRWNHIRDATFKSAVNTFGKREEKNPFGLKPKFPNSSQSSHPKKSCLAQLQTGPIRKDARCP
ncbi:hypothetical protein PoB_002283900 [Plakobranchus ocellatus]|uniref:Uncharacterized protein n=1 Tax=Plakobranchus ocellatus TaxID=259542 RepID=A0AAV3ZPN7_9GAST|nr:hypothetical protein PoB_002283900 [Plakobranchus ocellatus]